MYLILTLFFLSLAGITAMLWRKILFIKSGAVQVNEREFHLWVPDVLKIKHLAQKNTKRYGYLALVVILRLYFKFVNFFKIQYEELKAKIKKLLAKSMNHHSSMHPENPEVSGFLKMIGEYKNKIRHIKHKIKEEEDNK